MLFTILLPYNLKCVLSHLSLVYSINFGTLNSLGTTTFGTKHISVALIRLKTSNPSTNLNLFLQATHLSYLGWLEDLTSLNPSIVRSIMDVTWVGIIGQIIRMLVVPCGLVTGFAPKFCESRITRAVSGGNMVDYWLDVPSSDCAPRSCLSKLAI